MYLRIDENFASHPKTIAFVGRLQDPNAAMYLIKLWTWAVRSCPDGDLSEMLPWSIEDIVGYRHQDGKCYAAMVASGFVEEIETGSPRAIHNWAKRTGGDIAKMETEAQRKRNYRAAKPWDVLRLEILTRDGFVCKDCGRKPQDQSDLEVHHVIPLRKFEDKIAGNNPSNLRTLCSFCHDKAEAEYRKSEKTNGTAAGRRPDGNPPEDETAPETADTDKARQGKSRSDLPLSSLRGSDSGPAGARSNANAETLPTDRFQLRPGPVTGHELQRLFGEIRSRDYGGLPWQSVRVTGGAASTMAELLNEDPSLRGDVAPTISLLFKRAKGGKAGQRSADILREPSFAFGAWCSQWTSLREEVHGVAPKIPDAAKPKSVGEKPWLAEEKASEQRRGIDRAQRRIAQQELDRQLAGDKAAG
jgi:5-methylcytosine-specific restriction endonuclease McrA